MRRIELPPQPSRFGSNFSSRSRRPDPEPVNVTDNGDFLAQALGRKPYVQYLSRTELSVVQYREFPVAASLLVTNAHQCFDGHVGIRLAPAAFMDTIVRELAREVQGDPERYRSLFTQSPGRTIIRVRDDSLRYREPGDPQSQWNRTIGMFREPVTQAVTPETADMFVPDFASASEEDKLVMLLGLMDAASPYYDYRVDTLCGYPAIELDGPGSDWSLLLTHVINLAPRFPRLGAYFTALIPILEEVAATANGATPNEEFWMSFYKFKSNSGSAHVSGWVTALFAFLNTQSGSVLKTDFDWKSDVNDNGWGGITTLSAIPTGISAIPFIWELEVGPRAGEIPMHFVAGGLGIEQTDSGTLESKLGFAVVNAQ
jgi:hypothetical protein